MRRKLTFSYIPRLTSHPDMFAFEFLFLLGFPLLLACSASYFAWRALSRPLIFLIVATVFMYLLYATLMWLLDPGVVSYTLFTRGPGEVTSPEPWFLLLPVYKIPLIAFAVVAIPVLAILLRVFGKGCTSKV